MRAIQVMSRLYLNFNDILQDPTMFYDLPEEVLRDTSLTKDQKIKLLLQWKYDAILLQTATSENMSGGENSPLDKILRCLNELQE